MEASADAGYCSASNLRTVLSGRRDSSDNPSPTGRPQKHGTQGGHAKKRKLKFPARFTPPELSTKLKARRLSKPVSIAKKIVEPVLGPDSRQAKRLSPSSPGAASTKGSKPNGL